MEKNLPVNLVISLLHIQLNNHETTFTLFAFKSVNNFLNQYQIFPNPSAKDKSCLIRNNYLSKHRTHPVGHNLWNNLEHHIMQTNWLKMIRRHHIGTFGDQSDKSFITMVRQKSSAKKILNHLNHISTNNVPIFFIENNRHPIRVRSDKMHALDYVKHL